MFDSFYLPFVYVYISYTLQVYGKIGHVGDRFLVIKTTGAGEKATMEIIKLLDTPTPEGKGSGGWMNMIITYAD